MPRNLALRHSANGTQGEHRKVIFEHTILWQAAFTPQGLPADDERRERLASAYRGMWRRVTVLASEIANDLKGLTLHDERHFVALWERGSLIAGAKYPLNPLETFIFGAAILLHDAAHTLKAYKNGVQDVMATPEWKDSLVRAVQGSSRDYPSDDELELASEDTRRKALFDTLRRLHAERAKDLCRLSFFDPDGNEFHLLENAELRKDLGELIGLIAASHHWDVAELDRKFKRQQGAPSAFPGWPISPKKIACLLRCADAVQIDQSRAPSFSYALFRVEGLSGDHWKAQNRLSVPTPDADDENTLIFTSLESFEQCDAAAWWIAHDAITVANRELEACFNLLSDLKMHPFEIRRIRDAESPMRLSKHVETAGWKPVLAEVRIRDPRYIISLLGGEHLYGRDMAVPIRELIQNAADAVRAQRLREPVSGWVRVTLRPADDDRLTYWLDVEDNGIGMSEQHLTGPLLEFGTSYWSSELISHDRPGLVGKGLRQTGRYGIGFFSVLMATEHIIVSSRRYDDGSDAIRSLILTQGVQMRPLLTEGSVWPLPMSTSTRVSIKLTQEKLKNVLLFNNDSFPPENVTVTLAQLVGHLCPCVDCDILVVEDGRETKTHSKHWHEQDILEWLRSIMVAEISSPTFQEYLSDTAPLVQPVDPINPERGKAAIAFREISAGIGSVGGLLAGHFSRRFGGFAESYVGCLELESDPRRLGGLPAFTKAELAAWASNQASRLASGNFTPSEFYLASRNVSNYGGDPSPIAYAFINGEFLTLQAVVDILMLQPISAPIAVKENSTEAHVDHIWFRASPSHSIGFHTKELRHEGKVFSRAHIRTASHATHYYALTLPDVVMTAGQEVTPAPNSFLDCLSRYCFARGKSLALSLDEDAVVAWYIGEDAPRDGIRKNMEIRDRAVIMRLI